ncbi:MAG: FHA domain-containing protein [Deltaproteobacteria bacterium]|nr:FHA domain-containing protein [Deltaproteobacteria bacterium]
MRTGRGPWLAVLASVLFPAVAVAAPVFIASPPIMDAEAGELVLLVGGISEDGASLKPSAIAVEFDGEPGPEPKSMEVFSEYAQTAAEASQSWKSPLGVGLVYLWVKDIPAGTADAMLEGISGFFRRIPARTNVYVTLYGRKRQPIPMLKASDIGGQLHDIGFLPGDRPNLADAIRVDLKALLGDESAFKVLLVVTDGRDFDDSSGERSADFMAVAEEIDKAGVRLMVVSFPPPDADAEQSTKNLIDLVGIGGARRATEQPLEVQTALESLGQAIADMRRVRIELPWGWRNLGGTHKVRLNLTVDGKQRAIEVGKVAVPAGISWLLVPLAIIIGLLGGAAGVVLFLRKRARQQPAGGEDASEAVVAAAHGLIQRGLSAQRALVELTRGFPNDVAVLADLDPSVFADERYPLFRTRAGRRRFEELQALLSSKASDDSLLGKDLVEVLSQSIAGRAPPDQVASSIAARVPEDEWGVFSRMGLDELARALRASGTRYPVLATPRARGVALEIQAALRNESRNSAGKSLTVGWLVRATGPGLRGETLRLPGGRVVLGRAPDCQVRLDTDSQIAQQHAMIGEKRGSFHIEPMQGVIKVETKPVSGRVALGDGDTIEIGQSRYVFKCVSSGNVAQSRSGA